MKHPIDEIKWVETSSLNPNDYNPNVVFNQELMLLEYSILHIGWIQPILVTQNFVIIDGFHRYWLARESKRVRELTDGLVPVSILELSEPDRMMLTIRINRAKGSAVALRMSDLVKKLVHEHGVAPEEICKQIGATKDEVVLLLQENVFKNLDIEHHNYSKAWYPNYSRR